MPALEPSEPTALTPDLPKSLSTTAVSVFRSAMHDPNFVISKRNVTTLVNVARDCFMTALAPELKAYNTAYSYARRLPDELWLMAWAYLSIRDRVYVSQVCSYWRQAALNTPRLWCHIDYVTEDNGGLAAVSKALSRGRKLSLSLFITCSYQDNSITRLCSLLKAHAPRIEYIAVDALHGDTGAVQQLLSYLDDLSSLRTFIAPLNCHIGMIRSFPALEHLEGHLETILELPCMPSMQTLRVSLGQSKTLQDILHAFPNLQTLDVVLHNYAGTGVIVPHFRGRLSRIGTVRISELPERGENSIVDTLIRGPQRLELAYRETRRPVGSVGLAIFADLTHPTQVIFQKHFEWTTITAYEPGDRHRKVKCSASVAHEIWEHVNSTTIQSISIDPYCWADVFTSETVLEFPALQNIETPLPPVWDNSILTSVKRVFSSQLKAPNLSTLRLYRQQNMGAAINAKDVESLLRCFKEGRRLLIRILALRHVAIAGSVLRLGKMVDSIQYDYPVGSSDN